MRKNVLILGHNYATQFIDIFNQYTRLFDRNEYAVTVVYLSGQFDPEVKAKTIAEEVIFLDIAKKKLRGLKIDVIYKLLKLCQAKQFHIAIGHRYKPVYVLLWLSLFCRIERLFFVMHEMRTMAGWKRKLLMRMLKRKNILLAGVSNAVRDDIRRSLPFVPHRQIQTLYNVIDVELTEPTLLDREQARSLLNLSNNTFVFANIARLAINKDQQTLINAFALIHQAYPNTQLIILGDGELEQPLKTQVQQLGLEKAVIFTGFVANASQYMKAFDCFVLSSIQEAFGRVLLEAMLAKLPIIATAVNGIPEVLGDTGLIVKPRHTEELHQAMQKIYLLAKSDQQRYGDQGHQRVLEYFSIPAFSQQFWHTYHTYLQE